MSRAARRGGRSVFFAQPGGVSWSPRPADVKDTTYSQHRTGLNNEHFNGVTSHTLKRRGMLIRTTMDQSLMLTKLMVTDVPYENPLFSQGGLVAITGRHTADGGRADLDPDAGHEHEPCR